MSCRRYIYRVHTSTCKLSENLSTERDDGNGKKCMFLSSHLEFDAQVLVYFHADFKLLICLKFHTAIYNKDVLIC